MTDKIKAMEERAQALEYEIIATNELLATRRIQQRRKYDIDKLVQEKDDLYILIKKEKERIK